MLNNIIIGLVCFVLGALLAFKLLPKNEPYQPAISSKADAQAKCVVTKKTDSKGNTVETVESVSSAEAQSNLHINEHKPSLDIFLGAGLDSSFKAKASLGFVYEKHSIDLQSDFKKDHAVFYKYKVLSF